MIKLLFIFIILFSCSSLDPEINTEIFEGITETDINGNLIGQIDTNDWCSFEFDYQSIDTDFGLNPIYPNPITAQNWGPFGNSYQICFQYSTPLDTNWVDFKQVDISLFSIEKDTIFTLNDSYSNGQTGVCGYIQDSLVIDSIYRMKMISGEFECHGDIQFFQ